jgi:hypothetical protein
MSIFSFSHFGLEIMWLVINLYHNLVARAQCACKGSLILVPPWVFGFHSFSQDNKAHFFSFVAPIHRKDLCRVLIFLRIPFKVSNTKNRYICMEIRTDLMRNILLGRIMNL